MKPHIHRDLIKLWADGAEIQAYVMGQWVDTEPEWLLSFTYRVKPKTLKYRLWIGKSVLYGDFIQHIRENDTFTEHDVESFTSFVRWHGDWQEVEV